MSSEPGDIQNVVERFAELTEELLDAHCDTVSLVAGGPAAADWTPHIEYLKDLQRVGQRTLAELAVVPAEGIVREVLTTRSRRRPSRRGRRRRLALLRLPVGQLRRQ